MLKLADTVTHVTGISDFRLHSLPKSASGFGSRPSGNGTSSIGNLLEFWVYVSVSVVRNKASRYNAVAPAATGLRLGPARLIRAEQTEFIWARAARAVLIRSFSVRRALCGNHKHQLRACCCGTSCVPAAAGLLRVAGTAGVARREDPWTELLL